jgi:DNA mismatch repair protein MutS2
MQERGGIESKIFAAELGSGAPEIDLHDSSDTEGGVRELDQFLNHEFVNGEEVVKIIHGRGTGKMRQAVHDYLKTVSFVETFRDSESPSGIMGVTFAVLTKKE